MPGTIYTVVTQEEAKDLGILGPNKYKLQVAKSVSNGGTPTFNIVYQSQELAAEMSVAWSTTYGLNWTAKMPAKGAEVKFSGIWQECGLGQSYDLDTTGLWVPNQNNVKADKNSVNVGANHYPVPVHVMVGVKDEENGKWHPIWLADNALIVGGNGEYTPRQSVQIWFQEGTKSSTMIAQQSTPVQEYDMTMTPTYYFSYAAETGVWRSPQAGPYF